MRDGYAYIVTFKSAFFGTLDFVFDFTPGWVKKGTNNVVKRHIVTPTRVPGRSPFLTVRLLQKKRSLDLRPMHVLGEDEFVILDETDEPIQTRYVVQLHRADRAGRHFDVRIWYKGRAISWAVPMKGKRGHLTRMPLPGERWMARRQPDHTLAGFEFEGEISSGKGKGQVEIFAQGLCDIFKIEDGNVHVRFLDGEAAGDYVFVNTGNGGLIVSKALPEPDMWTKPNYTKRDVDYAEAVEADRDWPTVAETKVDGGAVEAQLGRAAPRIFSHRVSRRTGALIEHTDRLPHLRGSGYAGDLEGTRLRAEAWHPRGVNFLSGTLNSGVARARQTQRTAGPIRLQVFDITHYKGKDVRDLPYGERRALYERACEEWGNPHVQPVRQVRSGFSRFYSQQVDLKKMPTDGIVVKGLKDEYGERPIVKVKPSDFADCEVVRVNPGTGKHSGRLGSITVLAPTGVRVQVGTGFTDWERAWLWAHRDELRGEFARVEFHVRNGTRTHTGPRFHSWHPDKSEAALRMYAEALSDDPRTIYALKGAAGWRRNG